jgi:hypothetical protein
VLGVCALKQEVYELLASVAVNVAELKLLNEDAKKLAELKAEVIRFALAREDFTRKAIV